MVWPYLITWLENKDTGRNFQIMGLSYAKAKSYTSKNPNQNRINS